MESARKKAIARGLAVSFALGAALGLTACPEKEGPGEKVGKAVDEAAQDTKRAVEDATD
jgi:hypothetical protein